MNNLIKVNHKSDRQTVSARDLWEFLDKPHGEFMKWFKRYVEYGFIENIDFRVIDRLVENPKGGRPATDYEITVDMGKELAMLQKTEKGKMARQYFIELEKKWNSPESVMARALKMADARMVEYKENVMQLEGQIENDKPKVLFAEAVENSDDVILVKEMALILTQQGFKIGQNQLFQYLRDNEFLCKREGDMYHLPTKRYEDIFKVTKRTVQNSNGSIVKNTPKITGKGQMYFIKRFNNYKEDGITIKDLLTKESA